MLLSRLRSEDDSDELEGDRSLRLLRFLSSRERSDDTRFLCLGIQIKLKNDSINFYFNV